MSVEYHKPQAVYISPFFEGVYGWAMLTVMRASRLLLFVVMAAVTFLFAQTDKSTEAAKSTQAAKSKKATQAPVTVTFEAHNEGSVEGAIYGDENVVSVTIDAAGIRYQGKGMDKPVQMKWDQISDWQPNNFTSHSPGRAGDGDY